MNPVLPQVNVAENYDAMSTLAANIVLEAVREKPDSVLCVATGASPCGVYAALARHRAELGAVRILELDEWGGLDSGDPATCETYIRKHILVPWGVGDDRYFGFMGCAPSPEAACERMTRQLTMLGRIDVCILGMGADGHIGLNYPAETLPAHASPTDASTLRHAMLQEAQGLPTHGLTLGMADVLQSRRIVLVINGEAKAQAAERLVSGELSTHFPASLLWTHPNIHCILDREAAARITPGGSPR